MRYHDQTPVGRRTDASRPVLDAIIEQLTIQAAPQERIENYCQEKCSVPKADLSQIVTNALNKLVDEGVISRVRNTDGTIRHNWFHLADWSHRRPRVAEITDLTVRCEGIKQQHKDWLDHSKKFAEYTHSLPSDAIQTDVDIGHYQYRIHLFSDQALTAYHESLHTLGNPQSIDSTPSRVVSLTERQIEFYSRFALTLDTDPQLPVILRPRE